MKESARRFDLPKDSPEYIALAESAWTGGPLVAVRFYLGSFIGKNLFREPDDVVEENLIRYMTELTSARGAELVRGLYGWALASKILQFHFEHPTGISKNEWRRREREIRSVERYLTNPAITMTQLAADVGTTEKQLSRNTLLSHAKDLAQRAHPERWQIVCRSPD